MNTIESKWKCKTCGELNTSETMKCCGCSLSKDENDSVVVTKPKFQFEKPKAPVRKTRGVVMVSTTPEIPGRTLKESAGVVFGEVILGTNVLKDIKANVSDVFGARSGGYESDMKKARQAAMEDLINEARNLGANGIVGVAVGFESISTGNMMMVSASGTAVVLEES
jgi:uncharacterized protein YbjQ (UPF0145 family)